MTCPDWLSLRDRRDAEPEAWDRALAHFDGCRECRGAALDSEPTLLLRKMPTVQVDSNEVAAMQRAVAGMRRQAAAAPPRRPPIWLAATAAAAALVAAVLAAVTLGVIPNLGGPGETLPAVADARPAAVYSTAVAALGATPALEQVPLVEDVDPAFGQVIQVFDDQISLVLVLPPQPGASPSGVAPQPGAPQPGTPQPGAPSGV